MGEVLLELLGLAEMFAPPSAVALLGAGVRLTFEQLYAMCYLTQDLVDGSESVRGKANTAQSYRTIVELLLGLTDGPMRVLTARKDELTRTLGELRRRAGTIGGFLTGSAADLETELARSLGEERDALRSLEEFKGRMRAATAHADPFRRRVQELEQVLEQYRRAAVDAEYALVRERRRVQLLTEQRHHGPQPVSPCPACTADLSGRPVPDGDCPLCLSELDPEALAQALGTAQASLAAAEQRSVERAKAVGEAQTAWEQARAELDERTREDISPLAARIEQRTLQPLGEHVAQRVLLGCDVQRGSLAGGVVQGEPSGDVGEKRGDVGPGRRDVDFSQGVDQVGEAARRGGPEPAGRTGAGRWAAYWE
ncbi:hypothetical protein AMK26_34680 [Streptomyces sp. CB03234]|nr:hypothetical protein AMK26_34680 [Streptomyces sp. CB03234]